MRYAQNSAEKNNVRYNMRKNTYNMRKAVLKILINIQKWLKKGQSNHIADYR